MADYNINAVTRRVVFTGSAGVGPYAFSFEILDENDVAVYFNDALLTITTDYTVAINANGTGSVTIVTGTNVPSTPTASDQIVIVGARDIERVTDFVTAGDLLASSLNEQLDALTIFDQQIAEENKRGMRAPVFDPALVEDGGVVDMTLPAKASRAGKTLAFDSNGNPVVGEDIGNWRGDWAAGTSYTVRDLVKDPTNSNIYRVNTAHTSSGSAPISSNADVAKFDLVVDAASASDSASDAEKLAINPEDSQFTLSDGTTTGYSALHHKEKALDAQTAAEAAQSAAETAETNAETAQTAAEAAQTAAETAETNAAASAAAADATFDLFNNAYLGAKASDPTVDNDGNALTDGDLYFDTTNNVMKVYDLGTTTWLQLTPTVANQTNINTVAGISADVTAVAADATDIGTVATDLSGSDNIGTVAASISNVNTVATDIANVNTVATNIADVNNFADTYFVSATAPSSPTTGDLWFDTANSIMKVYDGSGFVNAGSSVNGTSERQTYTATSGQTTFSATYDAGYVDVYLNGVKLINSTDFTATNGTSIVLTTGAALNDTVDIVAYGTFNLLDQGATLSSLGIANHDSLTVDASGNVDINGNELILDADGDTKIVASTDDVVTFDTAGSERMRIDSSGNLLVGQSSDPFPGVGNTVQGISLNNGGRIAVSSDGNTTAYLNRKTSDGDIIDFRKDGTTVGSISSSGGTIMIGSNGGGAGYLKLGSTSQAFYEVYSGAIYPTVDNSRDLGIPSKRFDDVYATNGTIQTSDANEKQQIASLTDAEITAAKAISALFKTFKWNDKVEAKGDAARTHTGVIAQDVEAAMTAAGLDAGDYAFFISSDWYVDADGNEVEADAEGAIAKNRKGIRYPELLAFVGAATEQRLTDIETRLTALENA